MENERVGLICATLQNGIPVVMVKKTGTTRKASDYFRPAKAGQQPATTDPAVRKGRVQRVYDTMMQWVGATKGR